MPYRIEAGIARPQRLLHALVSFGPWPFILLALIERALLIAFSSSCWVSTDDAVMWHAAVDYAHGRFYGPYYYGQDYGPMLEALIAAPFARLGVPLRVLMPAVTSFLALVPYWFFAIAAHRTGHRLAATVIACMPLLLPLEYQMMTSLPRGFINGLSVLALLPVVQGTTRGTLEHVLVGAVVSVAWFVNPNSLVFSVPYVVLYLVPGSDLLHRALAVAIGTIVGIGLHHWAQAWCSAHPDRIVHHLRSTALHLDRAAIMAGLSNLDAHFRWLMPVLWPYGGMAGCSLVLLGAVAAFLRKWSLALALLIGMAFITVCFTVDKVHDGLDTVYYPLSRMFLALPLLLAWVSGKLLEGRRYHGPVFLAGAILVCACFVVRCARMEKTSHAQVASQKQWIDVGWMDLRISDARRVKEVSDRYGVGLAVPLPAKIAPAFRAYLYPVLEPGPPATYLYGFERRYWVRELYASKVVGTILFAGGSEEAWETLMTKDGRIALVDGTGPDKLYVIRNNDLATDELLVYVMRELGLADPG
ncbi:MAG TPA: hypothetical protein PLB89_11700 [Flavobacteriales bacterium]|nr:hypothetical protein [Flavobacteriales bacterium]